MLSKSLLVLAATVAAPAFAQTIIYPATGLFSMHIMLPGTTNVVAISAADGRFNVNKASGHICNNDCCEFAAPLASLWSDATSLENGNTGLNGLTMATLQARNRNTQKLYINRVDYSLGYTAPGAPLPGDAILDQEFIYTPEADRMKYGQITVPGRKFWACGVAPEWDIRAAPVDAQPTPDCQVVNILTRPNWAGIQFDSFTAPQ